MASCEHRQEHPNLLRVVSVTHCSTNLQALAGHVWKEDASQSKSAWHQGSRYNCKESEHQTHISWELKEGKSGTLRATWQGTSVWRAHSYNRALCIATLQITHVQPQWCHMHTIFVTLNSLIPHTPSSFLLFNRDWQRSSFWKLPEHYDWVTTP